MPDPGGPDARTPETPLSPLRGNPAVEEAARRFTQEQQARAEASYVELEARVKRVTAFLDRNLLQSERRMKWLTALLFMMITAGVVLLILPAVSTGIASLQAPAPIGAPGWLRTLGTLPLEWPGIIVLLLSRVVSNDITHERGEHTNVVMKITSLMVAWEQQDPELLKELLRRLADTERNPVLPTGQRTVELERNRWFFRSILDGLANIRRAGGRSAKERRGRAGRVRRAGAAASSSAAAKTTQGN